MPKPKLSLRDLFAVVTVAAVLVAWWVDHRRMASGYSLYVKYKEGIEAFEAIEGEAREQIQKRTMQSAELFITPIDQTSHSK